ncbi:Swi3-domain-containing protein [Cristinia sonorae]|uniref:Chromosome segregation in meiosis protein n=1 Tax=Cristinia sonorae TaxID=1940300 RepID=A0A8K0XUZ6_9AGAR|nr:Swi3-domain-containing protein [Cristinia sonorae]
MSVDLDSIWDAPVQPQSPPRPSAPVAIEVDDDDDPPGPPPSKRPRTTLFLSDSEDGSPKKPPPPRASNASALDPKINALFDDLDEDDGFQGLRPSLDIDALRREAARNIVKAPSYTPHEILPSSSPPRDGDGGDNGDGEGGSGKKDGAKPKRKQLPMLNEARLLGPEGFPALVKHTKDFKPRGKGQEVSDLNRLMQIYQVWAHKMYPKNHFQENVKRIEKLCHSKRMVVAMSVWRDESKGLVNGRKVAETLGLNSDGEPEDDDDEGAASALPARDRDSSTSAPGSPTSRHSQASSPPRPPSSASERSSAHSDDDIDIDALIQEDAERQVAAFARQPSPPLNGATSNYRSNTQRPPDPDDMDEDDDTLWSTFNDPGIFDDDHSLSGSKGPSPIVPPSQSAPNELDDEDMWDLMREHEDGVRLLPKSGTSGPAPVNGTDGTYDGSGGPVALDDQSRRATNDEGWDEMYI